MRRWLPSVFLIAIGVVIGAVVASLGAPALVPVEEPSAPTALRPIRPAPLPQTRERVLLVWTPGALPAGLPQRLAALPGVGAVTTVRAGTANLIAATRASGQPLDRFAPGWSVPLDAFAVDPRTYAAMLPPAASAAMRHLRPGSVVLGRTSARVRRAEVGDSLRLAGGHRFAVAEILDDSLVGGAEVVLTRSDGLALGINRPRFVLVRYAGARAAQERAIRRLLPPGTAARIRGPGETPFLRHGDAVIPQAMVKAAFGEFAYRAPAAGGRNFIQHPRWVREHIVTATVPLLGAVRCHRALIPALRGALGELRAAGLGHLVRAEEFAGCWNPRLISPGGAVSRHAWGIAVDLNAAANPTGTAPAQDARAVRVLQRWGFTWGGPWLVPDPMHFEYARPVP